MGADRVVIPERETGIKLAQAITSSSILDFIELSKDCGIAEIHTPESWFGKTLRELNIRAKLGVNIIAIRHDGKIEVAPGADFALKETRCLSFSAQTTSWQSSSHEAGAYYKPPEPASGAHPKACLVQKLPEDLRRICRRGDEAVRGSGKMVAGPANGRVPRGCPITEPSGYGTGRNGAGGCAQSVSTVDTPQGAMFVCGLPEKTKAELIPGTLLLDGIQDPGNLGTMLRTADALGVPSVASGWLRRPLQL